MKLDPNKLRKKVLKMIYEAKSGHIGGSFSIAELIAVLYSNYDIGGKDKLILSKGHAVPILYAALCETGKITENDLSSFRQINSKLEGHPVKTKLPFLDATTGSLGQGLSIAIGHALAKKIKNEDGFVFCIVGDGELQEGQCWEAIQYAAKMNLDNLICFLDHNNAQNDGHLLFDYENLDSILLESLWDCNKIDGHNMDIISENIYQRNGHPSFLILHTIKSKGVSFMENNPSWHCKVPTEREYKKALKELDRQ